MSTIEEQIINIEEEIRKTPYHKGTEHYIGMLRAKIAKLKDKAIDSQTKKGGGVKGYAIKKQGDATVVLVGPPSVGKSTLINKLTNAKSKIAPYEFTTVSVIPGMMTYKDSKIQILDVPGLIKGAELGKGRGREVLSVTRGSDLVVIITDLGKENQIQTIIHTLENNGIRINKKKPNINVEKKLKGGIIIHSNIRQDISKETIKEIVLQMGIKNAEITIKEKVTIDTLTDAFSKNRVYIPAIEVVNKVDLQKGKTDSKYIYISAEQEKGLKNLKNIIWNNLNLVRIYLVKESEPNKNSPMIVPKDYKLHDVLAKIGEEFAKSKKNALIWDGYAKYPGQQVSLSSKVVDSLQVRFI